MGKYEGLRNNLNAQKWTEEKAVELFENALEVSKKQEFDFIGEVAFELDVTIDVFNHLIKRFTHLKEYKDAIKRNCERNCYTNGKKGNIVPSMAIMNLKSNHGWTDRIEQNNNHTGDINIAPTIKFDNE